MKIAGCEYQTCMCNKVCQVCNFNHEEEEVMQTILYGMKDIELQRVMFEKNEEYKTSDIIISAIRAKEASMEQQSALSGESGRLVTNRKCHQCGKEGHLMRNCVQKPNKTDGTNKKVCGYCGDSRCTLCSLSPKGFHYRSETCKAKGSICGNCSGKGHFTNLCKKKIRQVTEEVETDQQTNFIRLHRVVEMPVRVNSLTWCDRVKKFLVKRTPHHTSLNMGVETLHDIEVKEGASEWQRIQSLWKIEGRR